MKTTYTILPNGQTTFCRFISRYQSENDYAVGLCCNGEFARVRVTDSGDITAPFCDDYGLTLADCIASVMAYRDSEKSDFEAWKLANPFYMVNA